MTGPGAARPAAARPQGFEGSISAQSPVDVLQFQHANRFSGSLVFTHGDRHAAVFFQQGEVVHAEGGGLRGEAAVREILAWPTGSFSAHPNVATFARTIDKRLDHLLIDSLRRLDEARREGGDLPAPDADPAPPPVQALPAPVLKVRALPGTVAAAVLKGGAPLHDGGPQAAALALRCGRLEAGLAAPLGRLLGLGELQTAAVASAQAEQLLLFRTAEADLAVAAAPGQPLVELEAAIRRALSARPAR